MRRNLPGTLGMAELALLTGGDGTDYRARAFANRPTDRDQLAAEVRRLHAAGLSARDISTALRLLLPDVIEVLPHSQGET